MKLIKGDLVQYLVPFVPEGLGTFMKFRKCLVTKVHLTREKVSLKPITKDRKWSETVSIHKLHVNPLIAKTHNKQIDAEIVNQRKMIEELKKDPRFKGIQKRVAVVEDVPKKSLITGKLHRVWGKKHKKDVEVSNEQLKKNLKFLTDKDKIE